jgi:hypothetical protein
MVDASSEISAGPSSYFDKWPSRVRGTVWLQQM